MSRINDFIKNLCPNGVEFKTLDELFTTRNGYTPSKSDTSNWTEGTIPWFRMEDIRKNGRVLDDSIQHIPKSAIKGGRLFPANSIIIATSATIGEHALITVPHLSNQRFTSLTLKPTYTDSFDIKFIFYYCFVLGEWCKNNTTMSNFATVDMNGFKKFKFPIPPIEVQRKIVKILDTFSKLEAELEAELEARRKQYTFYRDQLLTFTERERERERRIRWAKLSEIGEFIRGKNILKTDLLDEGIPAIHYGQVHTYYGTWATRTKSFVSKTLAKSLRYAKPGDLVIATTSEDDEGVGKAVAWIGDEHVAVSSDAYIYRHTVNPKYMAYLFQTKDFKKQKITSITGTKVRRISGDAMGKILIPIPPLDEQERIVSILDKFDALVNDLSSGLPAELNARRKQYEYYRDRLLTFQEAT